MLLKNRKFSHFVIVVIFVISVSVITTLNIYNTNNIVKDKVSFMQKEGYAKLDHQVGLMLNRISIIKNYSNSIAYMIGDLKQYDKKAISKILKSHFLKEIGIFQLRLLNSNGIELIRYDLDKHSNIIKAKHLQNKSNRYYYKEAKDIPYNDIYFSKFDLNIENGKIEIPYKNTTRVIKKIKINDQTYYIVTNYNLTDIFKHALSATIYDIFLIEKDNQINVHLDDNYSFSKQKNSNVYLNDLLYYDNQYITKRVLDGFPYEVVVCIKKDRLDFMEKQKEGAINKSIIMAILVSLIISFILLYFLEKNLKRFNTKALKIMEDGEYIEENEFVEFKNILDDLKIQKSIIQDSLGEINKQKNYIRSILESQSNFIIITDGKNLINANKAMFEFFGYKNIESFHKEHDCICDYFIAEKDYLEKEKDGKTWLDIILMDINKNLNVKMKDLSGTSHVFQLVANELEIELHSYVITFTDITEILILKNSLQNKVDEQLNEIRAKDQKLFEQAKLSSLGEMMENIAHQWRQPLSVISTAASGIKLNHELNMLDENDLLKYIDVIVDKTKDLSIIIDSFRDFINEEKEVTTLVLQNVLNNTLKMLKGALDYNRIKIYNNINSTNPITITIIPRELSQVVMNIINNAKDVLLQRKVEDPWIKLDVNVKENIAVILIEDNGGGIPEDIIDKIFEPYFTTKHQAQGTGLGLHTCYKIITEDMYGKIYAINTQDGAKFFIELPIC